MSFNLPSVSLGVSFTVFGIVIGALIFLYLLILLFQNSFISLGPVAMGRLIMFVFLLGLFVAWFIVGATELIIFTGILAVLFLFLFGLRARKRRKSAQQATLGRGSL